MHRNRKRPSRRFTSKPYREDCWSDGETSVLINEWGDRYLELNRGNIPQKQWQEVADAVNFRPCDERRPLRTHIQCKYRVDTLKETYKIEKKKIAKAGGSSSVSSWQFFDGLDFLICSSFNQNNYGNFNNNSSNNKNKNKPSCRVKGYQLPSSATIAANLNESGYDSDSLFPNGDNSSDRKRLRVSNSAKKEKEDGVLEMSKVIEKMVDVYEKVEMEKGKLMLELEKERMEFMKSIEIQRMQTVVDTVKLFTMKKSGNGVDKSKAHYFEHSCVGCTRAKDEIKILLNHVTHNFLENPSKFLGVELQESKPYNSLEVFNYWVQNFHRDCTYLKCSHLKERIKHLVYKLMTKKASMVNTMKENFLQS